MPETWKEPGYPLMISALSRAGVKPYAAGQALSMFAGCLLPLLIGLLAYRLSADAGVALVSSMVAAGSPQLVELSTNVLSESWFSVMITLMFLASAWRIHSAPEPKREVILDALSGVCFGLAYLLRSQAVLALPALLWLMAQGRDARRWARHATGAAVAALVVLSPWMVRNIARFGVPFYSDATLHGAWPYVDTIRLSHSLERPGSPLAFALSHPGLIAHRTLSSLREFITLTLPRELFGNPFWLSALAVAPLALVHRWKIWGFALLYALTSLLFFMPLDWAPRYFASSMVALAPLVGAGAVWITRSLSRNRNLPDGPSWALASLPWIWVAIGALGVAMMTMLLATRPPHVDSVDSAAAQAEAPFMQSQLRPDEAVMVEIGAYWSWFADRPSVHWVIADSTRFVATMRRLKVRWAAIPQEQISGLADRYPDHRLPSALVPVRLDRTGRLQLFQVLLPAAGGADPR
jgi:hypothetical protein